MPCRWLLLLLIGTLALALEEASGAVPVVAVDLASDTAWTLAVDDGPVRGIRVPGGGYNSDLQEKPWIAQDSVKDHVVYRRSLTIPAEAAGRATLLSFGAVNCGAEVALLDGDRVVPVTTHVGIMMPFTADLTGLVQPGRTYGLQVTAYPAKHYGNRTPRGFFYPEAWTRPAKGWASRNPAGITRWIRLEVHPLVRVAGIFLRPSVTRAELGGTLWLRNHGPAPATVTLTGALSSWNGNPWAYPAVPATTATVPAGGEVRVDLPTIPWHLGPASWWWPNKPFREDYRAQLHHLDLTVQPAGGEAQRWRQRFGFVEWSEGPYYYRVNGVRVNHLGDGTPEAAMSAYDCYTNAPAFRPPTGPGTGLPETIRRYQRLGLCTYRVHQSTPTPYLMDVADELGFMLIPETAIRCNQEVWDEVLIPQTVRDLAEVCRNHPSTCRYSLLNETRPEWVGPLADAIITVDGTRPLIFEDNIQNQVGIRRGRTGAHAYTMLHYRPHPAQAQMISGVGECAWANYGKNGNGLEDFAVRAQDGRCADMAYYAGWDLINYWPNFLEGMDAERHTWRQKECFHGDRRDGIDGWGSPVIRWVQQAFHPYLVVDRAFMADQGAFAPTWPSKPPVYAAGVAITRTLEQFNDTVHGGTRLALRWTARWDAADGPVVQEGLLPAEDIPHGFHLQRTLTCTAPATPTARTLVIVLESLLDGKPVFHDDRLRLSITPVAAP